MYTQEPGGLSGLQYTPSRHTISEKGMLDGRRVIHVTSDLHLHLEDEIFLKGNLCSLKHMVQHAIRGTIGLTLGAGSLGLGWLLSKKIRIWTLDLLMVPIDFLKSIPFLGNKIASIWNRYYFDKYAKKQVTPSIQSPDLEKPEQTQNETSFQPKPGSKDDGIIRQKSKHLMDRWHLIPHEPKAVKKTETLNPKAIPHHPDPSVMHITASPVELSDPSDPPFISPETETDQVVPSTEEEEPEKRWRSLLDKRKKSRGQAKLLKDPSDTETVSSSPKISLLSEVSISPEQKAELQLFCGFVLKHVKQITLQQDTTSDLLDQIRSGTGNTLQATFASYSPQEKAYVMGFLEGLSTVFTVMKKIIEIFSSEKMSHTKEYADGISDATTLLPLDDEEESILQTTLYKGIAENEEEGDSESSPPDDFSSISDEDKKNLEFLCESIISNFNKNKKTDSLIKTFKSISDSNLKNKYALYYIKQKNLDIDKILEIEIEEEEPIVIQNEKPESSVKTVHQGNMDKFSRLAALFIQQSTQTEENQSESMSDDDLNAVVASTPEEYQFFKEALQSIDSVSATKIIDLLDAERSPHQEEPGEE